MFFFAVIDPIGTVLVFIAVTSGYDKKAKKMIALKAILVSNCQGDSSLYFCNINDFW
jgi:multiple antibiotic resistance protein